MTLTTQNNRLESLVGIGYKSQYFNDLQGKCSGIGWLEIHAENYMIDGGPRKKMMLELAQQYPISCHGVGLSIGSEIGLDKDHLDRLAKLLAWLKPSLFSEHLAWSTHTNVYLNDLLPVPYSQNVLRRVCAHINQVQETLGRQMLLENPSSYLKIDQSDMSEIEFITEIVSATGCGLLLDINNVFVSASNLDFDPYDYINTYPLEHVGEIHLGGHEVDIGESTTPLLIDAHNHPVADPVWALYEYAIKKAGSRPTLIEWDNDLPSFAVLANEARLAADIISQTTSKAWQANA